MNQHAIATSRRVLSAGSLGYLLGTVPSAGAAARLASAGTVDLRAAGTGNPGGANAGAVLGRSWGYGVMAADIAKAAVAGRLGGRLAGSPGAHVASTAAVVGHCFPLWSGFRGGKGVACSVGQCLATFPVHVPIDLTVAAVTAAGPWRERAFAATATSSFVWVVAAALWWRRGLPNAWGPPAGPGLVISAAATSTVILQRFAAGARR